MSGENRADRAVETLLANLLIEISVSIKTDPAFRPDIVYDLNNPNSVILLVGDAMRELRMLGPKTATRRQNSEHVTTHEPGSAWEPEVSFQNQAKVLYRSAEQRIISYVPDNGIHFIDDGELEPIRRVFALFGRRNETL
jgi:hypothetical protein